MAKNIYRQFISPIIAIWSTLLSTPLLGLWNLSVCSCKKWIWMTQRSHLNN